MLWTAGLLEPGAAAMHKGQWQQMQQQALKAVTRLAVGAAAAAAAPNTGAQQAEDLWASHCLRTAAPASRAEGQGRRQQQRQRQGAGQAG